MFLVVPSTFVLAPFDLNKIRPQRTLPTYDGSFYTTSGCTQISLFILLQATWWCTSTTWHLIPLLYICKITYIRIFLHIDPSPRPPPPTQHLHLINSVINIISSIVKNVLSSGVEAKLGALFHNKKDSLEFCDTLFSLRLTELSTPITTVNRRTYCITNSIAKERRLNAVDIHYFGSRIWYNMSVP